MNALEEEQQQDEEEKHSENIELSAGVVTSIKSLKFDNKDEQVFFGSPIGEEQDHSSDDESFHSFYKSHRSSNVSITANKYTTTTNAITTASATMSNQTPIPPPPPPPFTKGNPPPPPPPSQSTPFGKDGSPLPKLKPLHWDKVRAAPDRSMVWDKLRASSFEFDEDMIESLFGYNLHNTNEDLKSKSPSPSKHVLDPKRLQNLTILLKALNATTEQVCRALVQAEAFVASILAIPYAFPRIEALLYRETFEDEVTHLCKTFSMLQAACKELKSSRLFLKLLEAVLKTGYRMNVGTIRGGAKAFKLDTLLKLSDVKGTDGKTTLLHFVVQEIVRSEGKTATIDFEVIASSVSSLSQGMSRLRRLVNKYLLMEEKSCSFVESMKSFLTTAQKHLEEMEEEEHKSLDLVKEITEYFHGNMSKDAVNPLRIFVIVRDFLAMLDFVCRELRRSICCGQSNPLAPFQ
nr:formin-like protein 11 [Tanacetum cinerariifolium]